MTSTATHASASHSRKVCSEWLFDFDVAAEVKAMPPAVLARAQDSAAARVKAAKAREFVQQRQKTTLETLKKELYA